MTDSPILAEARRLLDAGLPALPLLGPAEGADPKAQGKAPRLKGWQHTPAERLAVWWDRHPGSNLGLVTGAASGLVCVDVDPRNGGQPWLDTHRAQLLAAGGIVERTGSGGTHVWFRHPGGYIASRTGRTSLIHDGVELLADGGHQAVIAPSVHRCGQPYAWETPGISSMIDVLDFAGELPAWLATPGQAPDPKAPRKAESYSDDPADVASFRAYLAATPGAVEGQQGDHTTFKVCCTARDYDLSPETALALIRGWNAEKCQPAWSEDELRLKLRNAYRYAKAAAPGGRAPTKDFPDEVPTPPAPEQPAPSAPEQPREWALELLRTDEGKVKNLESNVRLILDCHEALRGRDAAPGAPFVRYNLFTGRIELACNPPWVRGRDGAEWGDIDDAALTCWLQQTYRTDFAHARVQRVVPKVAAAARYHPVRDYLESLPAWDGVPRLSQWLVDAFRAEPGPLVEAFGRCTLVAAIARVTLPRSKVDTVLILEGGQGTHKSTGLAALCPDAEWFTDADIDPASKDAAMALRGRWIVELGELHTLQRREVLQLKQWLAREVDRQRDPYARHTSDTPRQCVFFGTTNEDQYLRDPTGNRRYWPVRCGQVDIAWITANRDQLWAEALAAFRAGEQWWLTPAQEELAQAAQAERVIDEPWEGPIAAWLCTASADFGSGPPDKLTTAQIARGALGIDAARVSQPDANRIGAVMRRLGWKRQMIWVDGRDVKGWLRPR